MIGPHPHSNEAAIANQASHYVDLSYADLTAAANTQTISVLNVLAKMGVTLVKAELLEAFDFSDAALISCAITVGDGGSATRFLASMELAADGTTIYLKGGALTDPTGKYVYTTTDTVDVFVTGTSAKLLSSATSGKVRLHFQIDDARKPVA